jgi:hypothetical protein
VAGGRGVVRSSRALANVRAHGWRGCFRARSIDEDAGVMRIERRRQ